MTSKLTPPAAGEIPPSPSADQPVRIWVAHCPFKKNGFPSLGNFGASVKPVVILTMATWTRLCQEIPELGRRQFEVGEQHD